MEYYSAIKKEILTFETTWINLQGIMLGEISQTQKDKYCMISFLCEKKSQTHRIRGKISGCQGLRGGEMGLLFSCQAMSDSL